MLAKLIHFKIDLSPQARFLRSELPDLLSLNSLRSHTPLLNNPSTTFSIELNGQYPILETVVEKNIGKARRNDAMKPKVLQGPGSMLPAGAAAKIFSREQHRSILVARLIQRKIDVNWAIQCSPDRAHLGPDNAPHQTDKAQNHCA